MSGNTDEDPANNTQHDRSTQDSWPQDNTFNRILLAFVKTLEILVLGVIAAAIGGVVNPLLAGLFGGVTTLTGVVYVAQNG